MSMKFRCERDTLVEALSAAGRAVTTRGGALPVLAGVALKKFAREFSEGIEPFAPIVAVLTVALICSSIIGRSADKILAAGPTLIGAVVLLHSLGFSIGYFLSRAAGFSTKTSRTMSI